MTLMAPATEGFVAPPHIPSRAILDTPGSGLPPVANNLAFPAS